MNPSTPQPQKTPENNRKTSRNTTAIIGWAVGILVISGIVWMLIQNQELDNSVEVTTTQNTVPKSEEAEMEQQLNENSNLSDILKSKEFKAHALMGNQAVAPQATAKIYLNKKERLMYVDVKGLPVPPEGKVYQLWSLEMESLNATNIGVIDENSQSEIGLYKFENFTEPQTLCITLENVGGSKTPTMSQIYVMDAIHGN